MIEFRKMNVRWIVWALFFAALGSLVYFVATSSCMCGHEGMKPWLGLSIFAGFAITGVIVGRVIGRRSEFSGKRDVIAAIAFMFLGAFMAIFIAGNAMDSAHQHKFEPAADVVEF